MFAKALVTLFFIAQLVYAQSGTCDRTYTVQEGDICDSISAANNASTYQLAVVNQGVINDECTNLNPGSSICLGWNGEDCTNTYVVQANDDCEDIAAAYNINMTILYENNPQINSDCSNIYVGEVLCTAGIAQVPPAPASGTIPGSVIPATATPAIPYCD